MQITIFGVGRSGTKAVQLYLSYLIAQREKEVWVNYEPYFWMNRFTQTINYEGFYHHTHSPHLIRSAKELSKSHLRYLKKLSKTDITATTKFIRGNGRMEAINQVIQPDHSIVIVRDLYQVLVSVLKTEWDFWSVGFEYTQNWDAFVREVRQKKVLNNFDWCIDQISDRLDQNAFYWYVMNKAILQSSWPNTYFVHYSNIKQIEDIAREILVPASDLSINSELFTGDNIHENYPLMSKSGKLTVANMVNSLLFHTKLMNKYGFFISSKKFGSSAQVNMDYQKIQSGKNQGAKIRIEKRDLFEFFNEDITGMLKNIEWKNNQSKTKNLLSKEFEN